MDFLGLKNLTMIDYIMKDIERKLGKHSLLIQYLLMMHVLIILFLVEIQQVFSN